MKPAGCVDFGDRGFCPTRGFFVADVSGFFLAVAFLPAGFVSFFVGAGGCFFGALGWAAAFFGAAFCVLAAFGFSTFAGLGAGAVFLAAGFFVFVLGAEAVFGAAAFFFDAAFAFVDLAAGFADVFARAFDVVAFALLAAAFDAVFRALAGAALLRAAAARRGAAFFAFGLADFFGLFSAVFVAIFNSLQSRSPARPSAGVLSVRSKPQTTRRKLLLARPPPTGVQFFKNRLRFLSGLVPILNAMAETAARPSIRRSPEI